MSTTEARPEPAVRVLLIGGLLVVLIGMGLASRIAPYMVDDAYIFFRYAENLATGHGLRFNRMDAPVEGFSSPLWTLLLALCAWLVGGAALPPSAMALGLAAYVICMLLLLRLGRFESGGMWPMVISSLLPPALWGFSAGAVYYAITGMETEAFVVIVLLFHGFAAGRLPLWIGLLGAVLAPWTRPEAPFLFAATAVQLLAAQVPIKSAARTLVLLAVALAVGALALLAFRWSVFHDVLPNTYYAKKPMLKLGFQYLWSGLRSPAALPVLIAGTIGAVFGEARHRGYAVASLAWLGAAVIEGGDWMPAARFFQPALVLAALAAGGLGRAWTEAFSRRIAIVGSVATAGCLTAILMGAETRTQIATHNQMLFRLEEAAFNRWFQSSGANSIAMVDIGGLGFSSPDIQIVDLCGLTDVRIAHAPGGSYRKEIDPGYVLDEKRPDVIELRLRRIPQRDASGVLAPIADDTLSQPEGLLVKDPRLNQHYRLLFVQAPRTDRTPLYARAIYVRRDFVLPPGVAPGSDIVYDRSGS